MILTWMDYGTFALLFGMMIIVVLFFCIGVFEYIFVYIVEYLKGSMWCLFFMFMIFDVVLSAFLDNVIIMLFFVFVALFLCKVLNIDLCLFLILFFIFGNIGGCFIFIGDFLNIIIGNVFKEYIGFVDFLRVFGSGVLFTMLFIFVFVKWYYGDVLFG